MEDNNKTKPLVAIVQDPQTKDLFPSLPPITSDVSTSIKPKKTHTNFMRKDDNPIFESQPEKPFKPS